MSTPSLVVFDLLGTLVADDGVTQRCFIEALRRERLLFSSAELDVVSDLPLRDAFTALIRSRDGRPPSSDLIETLLVHYVVGLEVAVARRGAARDIEDAWLTLVALDQAGVKVAVDTPLPRAVVEVIIPRSQLFSKSLVAAMVTSDDVARGRPQPDAIALAMKLTGVSDPARVAKVGTTPADLAQGTLAGCGWVVGASYGRYAHDELIVRPHTHLISRLPDLLGLFAIDRHSMAKVARARASSSL